LLKLGFKTCNRTIPEKSQVRSLQFQTSEQGTETGKQTIDQPAEMQHPEPGAASVEGCISV